MTTVDSQFPPGVASFLALEHGLYIGGRWRPSASGETITSIDPATGRPLATFARGGKSDVDAATG
jgi:hypothetical protein